MPCHLPNGMGTLHDILILDHSDFSCQGWIYSEGIDCIICRSLIVKGVCIMFPEILTDYGVNRHIWLTGFCSIRNWIADLFWKQLDLSYPGAEDAMVFNSSSVDLNLTIGEYLWVIFILHFWHHRCTMGFILLTITPVCNMGFLVLFKGQGSYMVISTLLLQGIHWEGLWLHFVHWILL